MPSQDPDPSQREPLDLDPLEPPEELPLNVQGESIKLWLDDWRPAPDGWIHVTLLTRGLVEDASLDHDLGRCADCCNLPEYQSADVHDNCPHVPNGYDLCLWMARTGNWPRTPPAVHSGNVEGAARMRGLIMRHWHAPDVPPEDLSVSAEEANTLTKEFDDLRLEVRSAGISVCDSCGRATVYRRHRRSGWDRLRSNVLGGVPVRCRECGWEGWIKGPLLVRLEPVRSRALEPAADEFDHLDP